MHRIGIAAPLEEVHAAVSSAAGVSRWWTRDTTGVAGSGDALEVRFRSPAGAEIGRMAFDVTNRETGSDVRWRFTAGPDEWVGTAVTFRLSRAGDLTVLVFGHRGWREAGDFMAHCSMKWATFLLSLRQYAETGAGRPAPDDLKIDDWN